MPWRPPDETVIDGELVALDEQGKPNFKSASKITVRQSRMVLPFLIRQRPGARPGDCRSFERGDRGVAGFNHAELP